MNSLSHLKTVVSTKILKFPYYSFTQLYMIKFSISCKVSSRRSLLTVSQ